MREVIAQTPLGSARYEVALIPAIDPFEYKPGDFMPPDDLRVQLVKIEPAKSDDGRPTARNTYGKVALFDRPMEAADILGERSGWPGWLFVGTKEQKPNFDRIILLEVEVVKLVRGRRKDVRLFPISPDPGPKTADAFQRKFRSKLSDRSRAVIRQLHQGL